MIDLIIILGIAGSIWGGVLLVRGSLHAGCLAYLLSRSLLRHSISRASMWGRCR